MGELTITPPAESSACDCWNTIKELLSFENFYVTEVMELRLLVSRAKASSTQVSRLNYCLEQVEDIGEALVEEKEMFLQLIEGN